jgi:hypothetical protein
MENRVASRRLSMGVTESPTETLPTDHLTRLAIHFQLRCDPLLVEPLMIALGMIVSQILRQHMTPRRLPHDDHPVECLLFDRADEAFAVGVQIGTPGWQHHRLHAAVAQELVERVGELAVPVVDEISLPRQEAIKGVGELPRTLHHEGLIRMGADSGNVHSARAQRHDHQHIIRHQSMPGDNFHREKVRGGQDVPMHLDELCPAHARLASFWCGIDVVAAQDMPHGDLVDVMSQIRQGALDAAVSPGRILLGHTHDER